MDVEASVQELKPGKMLPYFQLPATYRLNHLGPWDYKQHKNLVLFFFHNSWCTPCRQLLGDLAKGYFEYSQLNTEVLAISQAGIEELGQLQRELELPFPLLSDIGGKVFGTYLGQVGSGLPKTAVFIADRYGALYTSATTADADELPSGREIRDWLWFIEIQCPECFPPEWPL
jgi:peroxiredoxin